MSNASSQGCLLIISKLISKLYKFLIFNKISSLKLRNYDSCLSFMRTKRRCECVGIQPFDLIDCANVKIMLGFLFLIKHDYEYKYLNEMIEEMRMSAEMTAAALMANTTPIAETNSNNISDQDDQSDDDNGHADQLEVQSLKVKFSFIFIQKKTRNFLKFL